MGGVEHTISGLGILRAIELSRSSKKPIYFVYNRNRNGEILRVGYTLEEPTSAAQITWFDDSEIEVSAAPAEDQLFDGKLNVEMDHPKEQERHFLLEIPAGDDLKIVLRMLFRVHSDGNPDFVIQVEVRDMTVSEPRNVPVVRYDVAHGYLHCDRIASDGKKSKIPVSLESDVDPVSFIVGELRENLVTWMAELGYPHFDATPATHASLDKDLDKAEGTLTQLVEDPAAIVQTKSTLITYSDEIPGGLVNVLDELTRIRTKRDLVAFMKASPWVGSARDMLASFPDDAVISNVELPDVPGGPLKVTYSTPESG